MKKNGIEQLPNSCYVHISADENGELIMEAKTSIKKGKLLFISAPYVIAPEVNQMQNVCSYCYNQFDTLYRCSKCRLVCYCSKECQKADWKFHRMECPYFLKLTECGDDKQESNLLIEMLLIRLLIMTMPSLYDDMPFSPSLNGIDDEKDYLFPSKRSYMETLLQRQFDPPTHLCFDADSISTFIKSIVESVEGNRLSSNLLHIKKCYFALKQNLITLTKKGTHLGRGMYFPLPYLLTRSQPNTYSTFKNNILYVYAERDIRKGEMISFSYVSYSLPFFYKVKLFSERCLQLDMEQHTNELCCLMDMVCPNGHLQAIPVDLLRNHKLKDFRCTECNTCISVPFLTDVGYTFWYDDSLELFHFYCSKGYPFSVCADLIERIYGPNNYQLLLVYNQVRDHYLSKQAYEEALPYCYKIIHYREMFLQIDEDCLREYLILCRVLQQLLMDQRIVEMEDRLSTLIGVVSYSSLVDDLKMILAQARQSSPALSLLEA